MYEHVFIIVIPTFIAGLEVQLLIHHRPRTEAACVVSAVLFEQLVNNEQQFLRAVHCLHFSVRSLF